MATTKQCSTQLKLTSSVERIFKLYLVEVGFNVIFLCRFSKQIKGTPLSLRSHYQQGNCRLGQEHHSKMKFLIPFALIAIIPSWAQDSIGCSVEGECVQSSMLNTGSSIELEQACLENCVVSELGNNWKLTKKSMLVDISGTSVQSMFLWRFIFQR